MSQSAEPCSATLLRVAVLVSGNGSNLQAILDAAPDLAADDASRTDDFPVEVVAVVSNRPDAGGLARAITAGVPTVTLEPADGELRPEYDSRLSSVVSGYRPDLVVLAGWMRILTASFLTCFPDRVINLHPALPGELPGVQAIERAWQEALAGERTETGVMVHLVPDEGVDNGPVLASEPVEIRVDDTFETLATRVHATEHRLLVDTIRQLARCHLASPDTNSALPC